MKRCLASAAGLLAMALGGCGRSCADSRASDAAPPSEKIEVGAPPRISAPNFREQAGSAGFGLPAGCAFDGPIRAAPLPDGKTRLSGIGSALDRLALANAPADGGTATTRAGLIELASGRVFDAPWAELDAPPLFEHASTGFVATWSMPTSSATSRAIFWRSGGQAERLLEGDGLSVVDLFCRGGVCATLSTLERAAAAPGATLVYGTAGDPVAGYRHVDFEPGGDDAWRPLSIASFDDSGKGFVALASKSHSALMSFGAGKSALESRFDTPNGAYAAAGAKSPVVVAPGAPVDRPCGRDEFPIEVHALHGPPHELRTPAAPENLALRPLGTGALLAWIAPVSCQYLERRVLYAALIAPDGSVATSAMAVADAQAFALATDGNRASFFLVRNAELIWVRARCD